MTKVEIRIMKFEDYLFEDLKAEIIKELADSQEHLEKAKLATEVELLPYYKNLDVAYAYITTQIELVKDKDDLGFLARAFMFEVQDLELIIQNHRRNNLLDAETKNAIAKFNEATKDMTSAEAVLYEADTGLEEIQYCISAGDKKMALLDFSTLALFAEKLREAIASGDDVMIALEEKSTTVEIDKLLEKMVKLGR